MAFSAAFSHTSFIYSSSFSQTRKNRINYSPFVIKAENSSSEPQENNEKPKSQAAAATTTSSSTTATATKPKKPVYSMKKGQIVRVEKEKYLNSINVSFVFFCYFTSICLLIIHLITKVWTTYMKTVVRYWIFVYSRQENMHLLDGSEYQLHQLGFQQRC
ncbi:NAD(P)H-quinone oxidoreductase subunit O, chloroplastic isoform X4 [Solanum lycopersicum]|uniref:NAD(P)H-quinone oxidoreductase subunit O, chloroplastic isoform X4 n=1 Tax=Solanum lycopersicum TaxID=4081 RepID=UPI000E1E1890|nr:NAD(P)H-quinone oxidoreductase subunit O, chloroplastic isoform X4 [Solanum lycopersicum]